MPRARCLFASLLPALLGGCLAGDIRPPRTIAVPVPCVASLSQEPEWAPPAAPPDANGRLAATLAWGAEWRASAVEARSALKACMGDSK